MDVYSILLGVWAFGATAAAWFFRRITAQEIDNIVGLIIAARDKMSEGGEEITPDEALVILDALIDALRSKDR